MRENFRNLLECMKILQSCHKLYIIYGFAKLKTKHQLHTEISREDFCGSLKFMKTVQVLSCVTFIVMIVSYCSVSRYREEVYVLFTRGVELRVVDINTFEILTTLRQVLTTLQRHVPCRYIITLHYAFLQGYMEVGYSPLYMHY